MHRHDQGSYRSRKQQKAGGGIQQIIKKTLTQTIQSKKRINSLEKELLIHKSSTVNPLCQKFYRNINHKTFTGVQVFIFSSLINRLYL